ncbi:MAG: von Willebrand factor type A domain-containing protein [Bacteroidales bacterium]|nr:von Willebrand factor type A domain-containing protein [Bacteroidales bacterium]
MKKKLLILIAGLFIMCTSNAYKISGVVTDDQNNPLPGVSVIIKGTTTGTITDINGLFTIEVSGPEDILVFSYVGFETHEVKAAGKNNINVSLTPDLTTLDEIVVVGYGKEKKSFLTGAVSGVRHERCSAPQMYYASDAQQFNTEGYSTIHENGFKNPLRSPLSTFSIDVDAASYSNVRRFINQGSKPPIDAVRIEEMINYFDYDYKKPKGEHPFKINYELGQCPWNSENLLLHIGMQGKEIEKDNAPASNLVFLIDVSGSMSSSNKLPLLKKAFKLLVDELRDEDRVAIVVYAGSSGLVLPSTPGHKKAEIIASLERLSAGGSTAGAAGLQLAYEVAEKNFIDGGNNRIILATDGDFNVGPSSNAEMERMIEKNRDKGIFISVAGFGMGNYKDDKMEIIADKGNGNYAYIDNLLEAKKVFVNEFTSTLFTIAKDVKIQIEFNPNFVAEYRLVGYENRLLNEEDFDDDKKDAGELGAGHTVTALYEIVPKKKSGSKDVEQRLKYQQTALLENESELATIKFRYKLPDENTSKLIVENILYGQLTDDLSDNFKFSSAVAGFGMLLRESEYARELTYDEVLKLARVSKGEDYYGYRNEFIRLVELSKLL